MNFDTLPHVTGELTYLAKMAEKPHTKSSSALHFDA
jgi:hypothetical protein